MMPPILKFSFSGVFVLLSQMTANAQVTPHADKVGIAALLSGSAWIASDLEDPKHPQTNGLWYFSESRVYHVNPQTGQELWSAAIEAREGGRAELKRLSGDIPESQWIHIPSGANSTSLRVNKDGSAAAWRSLARIELPSDLSNTKWLVGEVKDWINVAADPSEWNFLTAKIGQAGLVSGTVHCGRNPGTWTLEKPGFFDVKLENGDYCKVVFDRPGHFYASKDGQPYRHGETRDPSNLGGVTTQWHGLILQIHVPADKAANLADVLKVASNASPDGKIKAALLLCALKTEVTMGDQGVDFWCLGGNVFQVPAGKWSITQALDALRKYIL